MHLREAFPYIVVEAFLAQATQEQNPIVIEDSDAVRKSYNDDFLP